MLQVLKTFCDTYVSNTLAAGGSQNHFTPTGDGVNRGRIYYRVFEGGTFDYAFLFSNTIDSTFSDGKHSYVGYVCDSWELLSLSVGIVNDCDKASDPAVWNQVSVQGTSSYTVKRGELFATDPIRLTAEAGQYLCVEIAFSGNDIPYHAEAMIPSFVWDGTAFVPSREMPFPSMVGCNRKVQKRIAFLGDSITQGIGVTFGSYEFWDALLAERLGHQHAYWNLGLGFGRAMDAATDGVWLNKAKQNDAVILCFGVNDIGRGRSAEQIIADLNTAVEKLTEAGCRVLLQTVPPFDYTPENREKWEAINNAIRQELAQKVDAVFDVVPTLGQSAEEPHRAKYGGHPNEEGGRAWADALFPVLQEFING